jgi:hypothetical protein
MQMTPIPEPEKKSALKAPFKRRHWLILIGVMALSVVFALSYWARFESYSVCLQCALQQKTIAWEIPFFHRSLYESSQVTSNRLSEVIQMHGLALRHEHDWQLVFGSGNGSTMVFGTSRAVASAMTSARTGDFLDEMMLYAGEAETREWLSAFQNADRAEWCRCIAEAMQGRTFSGAEEFKLWLAQTEDANRHFQR